MMVFGKIVVSLLPVILFLGGLRFLDSYKLVKPVMLGFGILSGSLAALLALFLNQNVGYLFLGGGWLLAVLFAPVIEELLKALYPYLLFRQKRIGFMVDGAIIGFAAGTGFAITENIYYLFALDESNLLVWIIRGLGTAVMHGGATAILMIVTTYWQERYGRETFTNLLPGLAAAVAIHALFNSMLQLNFLAPEYQMLAQLILLPLLISFIFNRSENSLRQWMDEGLEEHVELLNAIRKGQFSDTKAGHYVYALRERFPVETVVDMFCYIQIYMELAARAKALLMMREQGFVIDPAPDIESKFTEMNALGRNIGKIGNLAIAPLLRMSPRDLWQLYYLQKQ